MQQFARMAADVVAEIIEIPDQAAIADYFHPDIVASLLPASEEVSEGWSYDGVGFNPPQSPSLELLREEAIATLTVACVAAMVGGYTSNALGSGHLYPSKINDQINMMGSVTDSLLPDLPADWTTPFWCADEAGVWAFRPHSAEQIQTAGARGKQLIVDCQTRLGELSAEVAAAATVEAVQAIVWEVA